MTSHPYPLLCACGNPMGPPKPREINIMHTLESTCLVSIKHMQGQANLTMPSSRHSHCHRTGRTGREDAGKWEATCSQ